MVKARSRVSGVVLSGPLAPFCEVFRAELLACGYTPRSVVPQLRQMGRLSCWLQEQALTAAELNERQIQEFLAVQRAAGRYRSQWSRVGLRCLLEVLREQSVAPGCEPTSPESVTEVRLTSFSRYLLQERGLAAGTVCGYAVHARQFLIGLPPLELGAVTAREVTAAVLAQAGRGGAVSTTQNFIAGLRAFLRYCFLEGLVDTDLSEAALAVTGRRRSRCRRASVRHTDTHCWPRATAGRRLAAVTTRSSRACCG